MTNIQWRGVALLLAAALVLVVGFALAEVFAPGTQPPSTLPTPTATPVGPTPTAGGSSSFDPTSEPSVSQSVPASPSSPSPSPSGPPPAAVTIRGLTLDAQEDPNGRDRRLLFTTDDPATINVSIRTLSPRGTVAACLVLNDAELFCTSGSTFTLNGRTSRPNGAWELTLRGEGIATPELDVTLEFPAAEPTLTIHGAWFDGATRPDHNGLAVELTPRAGPLVSISATWEGSHDYRLTVQPPAGPGLAFEGTGNAVAQGVLLAGGELHRIELRNTGAGTDHVDFTATIAWS